MTKLSLLGELGNERPSQSVRVRSFLSFNALRHQTNQKALSRRITDADDQRRMGLF